MPRNFRCVGGECGRAPRAGAGDGIGLALFAGAGTGDIGLMLEHGTWLDQDSVALFKRNGAWLVPTLLAGETVAGGPYDILIGAGAKASNYAITYNAENKAFTIEPRVGSGLPITPASATASCSINALSTSNGPTR